MLLDKLQQDLAAAQKARDQIRVDTLRFLLGAVMNLQIEKYPPSSLGKLGTTAGQSPPGLTDEDVTSVIKRQVKTHNESIQMFGQGGRDDLVEREKQELTILQSYLPAQMPEDRIRDKIQEIKKNNPGADFGTLMKQAMAVLGGQADGAVVAKILKES